MEKLAVITANKKTYNLVPIVLDAPQVSIDEIGNASWQAVENAEYYLAIVDGEDYICYTTSLKIEDGQSIVVQSITNSKYYACSEFSESKTYTLQTYNLEVPQVSVSETGLASWQAVENATSYGYVLNNQTMQTTNQTSIKLNDGDTIKVKAIGDGVVFLESEYSQSKSFSKLKLANVEGLSFDKTTYTFSWNEVLNATNYVVSISNQTEVLNEKVSTCEYVFSGGLLQGEYVFSVKAINDEELYFDSNQTQTSFEVEKLAEPVVSYNNLIFTITTVSLQELGAKYDGENVTLTKVDDTTYTLQVQEESTLEVWAKGDNILILDSNIVAVEALESQTYEQALSAIKEKITPSIVSHNQGSNKTISNITIAHVNHANGMVFFTYKLGETEIFATITISGLEKSTSYAQIVSKMPTYTLSEIEGNYQTLSGTTKTQIVSKAFQTSSDMQKVYDDNDIVWVVTTPVIDKLIEMHFVFDDGYYAKKNISFSTFTEYSDENILALILNNNVSLSTSYDVYGCEYVDLEVAFSQNKTNKDLAMSVLSKNIEKTLNDYLSTLTNNALVGDRKASFVRIEDINKLDGNVYCRYVYSYRRSKRYTYNNRIALINIPQLMQAGSYEEIISLANGYTYNIVEENSSCNAITDKAKAKALELIEGNNSLELYYKKDVEIVWAKITNNSYRILFEDGTLIDAVKDNYPKAVTAYVSLDQAFNNEIGYDDINITLMKKLSPLVHQEYDLVESETKTMPCVYYVSIFGECYFTFNGFIHRAYMSSLYECKSLEEIYQKVSQGSYSLSSQKWAYDKKFYVALNGVKRIANDYSSYSTYLTNLGYKNTEFTFDDVCFFVAPCFEYYGARKFTTDLIIYTKDGRRFTIKFCIISKLYEDYADNPHDISVTLYSWLGKVDNDHVTTCTDLGLSLQHYTYITEYKQFIANGYKY